MSHLLLEDLCELIVDCKNRTPPEARPGTLVAGFAIGTPNIIDGRIRIAEAKPVDQETFNTWTSRAIPREGDVVLTREAPVGRVGRVEAGMDICLGQRTMLLRPSAVRSDSRFLHYLLLSPVVQDLLHGQASGSTVAHLRVAQVRELKLPEVPDAFTQRRIGAVLGALDDKISVNERIAATARALGMALFAQGAQGDGAVDVEVNSVANALTRGVAPKYSDAPDELIVLNQKCIRDGRVNLSPARRTLSEKVKAPKVLHRNDVLVNSTGVGTLGRVARWTSDSEATVDSHVTIVRFDAQQVDPVCAGFAMLRAQPDIEAMGEGSTGQTELRRAQVGGLEITLPSPSRQRELRVKLDSLEDRADQALIESIALATLRDTLLPQLMSGRLRVKDAEKIVEDHV
ncbi:restriction endonuclease subunit S [Streptomyces sp. CB02923]|uniref:restriction endonuclease subunit S n=1 Tax=Streptomyces sp. CB02923 TaxID=1718985 RepID=UPI00093ED780|nr:restriction endonuclease subunit S [Streptomyces sp. CB02923]